MKFHCDRCKTRYSIADERVRGKILKIRCKNCEAVITVREGMGAVGAGASASSSSARGRQVNAAGSASHNLAEAASPRKVPSLSSGTQPALEKAFNRAMTSSAQESDFDDDATVINDNPGGLMAEGGFAYQEPAPARAPLPDHLEEEWYVSMDGGQDGPFNLDEAKEWVRARRADDELYCWCEGFDDWLPVEKVSHFRSLRGPAPVSVANSAIVPTAEPTPRPLFAATMAALEAEGPGADAPVAAAGRDLAVDDRPMAAGGGLDDDFDLDVGEASRVVKLPMLLDAVHSNRAQSASAGDGAPEASSNGKHKVGSGSGGFATVSKLTGGLPTVVPLGDSSVGSHSLLAPPQRRYRGIPMWGLLAVAAALAVGATMLITFTVSEDSDGDRRVRRSRLGNEELGLSLEPRQRGSGDADDADDPPAGTNARRPVRRRGLRPSSGRTGGGNTAPRREVDPFAKQDDIDFGDDANKPLSADEVISVYRDNRLAVQWCYEQALKKDPLLDVTKVYVFLTVAPSGVVTDVRLSAEGTTPLGRCLTNRIRRWKFRKSPELFSSKFPLMFQK